MLPRPITVLAALALGASALAACGKERNEAQPAAVVPSETTAKFADKRTGMRLELPANIVLGKSPAPGVFRASLGDAYVAGFAYPRGEQLPRDEKELEAAERRLIKAARERDRSYKLRSSRTGKVNGARSVELLGDQTIGRARLRIRSVHVYKRRAEYIVEIGAPVAKFAAFAPKPTRTVRRTLKVTGVVKQPDEKKKKKDAREKDPKQD